MSCVLAGEPGWPRQDDDHRSSSGVSHHPDVPPSSAGMSGGPRSHLPPLPAFVFTAKFGDSNALCPFHSFTKATVRRSAPPAAPCRCPGTGAQVGAQRLTKMIFCVCQINLSVFDSLESDGLFVDAGHVGPPLPCNYIKLVDVPEMNYFAANGEGEVSRWFSCSTEFSPKNPGTLFSSLVLFHF